LLLRRRRYLLLVARRLIAPGRDSEGCLQPVLFIALGRINKGMGDGEFHPSFIILCRWTRRRLNINGKLITRIAFGPRRRGAVVAFRHLMAT
jgi:hypothetical protein